MTTFDPNHNRILYSTVTSTTHRGKHQDTLMQSIELQPIDYTNLFQHRKFFALFFHSKSKAPHDSVSVRESTERDETYHS